MNIGAKMLERMQHLTDVEGDVPTRNNPLQVALQEGPIRIQAKVEAYDTLGVGLRELAVAGNNDAASLENLAQAISDRVTYLWEPIALIERDLEREQVQMRSAPPLVEDQAIEFYEAELTRQEGTPHLQLVRYRRPNGPGQHDQVTIVLTHTAFRRLADDLSDLLRAPQTE